MKKLFLSRRKPLFFIALFLLANLLGAQTMQTFAYTGAVQYFTVPACVTSFTVEAYGAQGHNDLPSGYIVNQGGYARGCFTTTPGNVYNVYVGGQPTNTVGGFNGGGSGYPSLNGLVPGAGGGGASDVRFGGTTLNNRIIVAGGGGGGGSDAPGNWVMGGGGGGLVGTQGMCYDGGCAGPQPGTQSGSGPGMCSGYLNASMAGGFGYGGNAIPACLYGFDCGGTSGTDEGGYGGGGGWYGGGAGASNFGGGGGSGYLLPSATFTFFATAVKNGHGQVLISYDLNMSLTAVTTSCSPTGSAAVTATGGIAPLSYTWSGTAQTTSLVTGLAAGIHTITVSDLGNCRTATTTINITRPSTLTVNNATICSGQSTTLAVSSTTSYTWSPGATLNATNTASVQANPTITTIYTVNTTNSLSCQSTNTAQVFVNPTPTSTAANATICIGNSATLSASPLLSYTWSPGTGLNSTSAQSVTATPLATTVYTVSFSNAAGCVGSRTMQVLVNSTQTATIPNATACVGQTLSLSANGLTGTAYQWSGPLSFSSTIANPNIGNATTNMSGAYNFSVASAAGCTTQAVANATVFALPSLTITSNAQLCPNSNLNLSASGGATTYTWTGPPPNNFSSNAQNTLVANVSPLDAGIYVLTGAFANGCSSSVTQSVTVTSLPVTSFTYSTPVCVNGTLAMQGPGSGAYAWSGPNGFTSSAQNPSITNVQATASGVYTLVTTLNSCTASATQSITVHALPVPTASNNSAICESSSLQLGATAGVTYTWSGPGGFSSTQQNASINNVLLTNAGVYTVTVTDNNGCQASTTTSATILPNPTISVTGATVCLNQPGILGVSGGTSCAWTGPGGFTSPLNNPTITPVNNITAGIYTAVVTAANTCTTGAAATLTFLPLPNITATGATVCLNSTATLSASGAASYTWTGANSYSVINANATFTAANAATAGAYIVTGTGANGCRNTATATLATLALPVPTATNNSAICESHSLQLGATAGVTYTWSGPGGYSSTQQNPTVNNALLSNAGIYSVTVSDANNCKASTTTSVTILPNPAISVTGATVCLNQAGILAVSGGTSCAWAGPGGFTSSLNNPTITLVNNLTAGAYTAVITAANSCTTSAAATLTFLPLPAIAATGATVCLNAPATLSASGAASYTWTGANSYSTTGSSAAFTSVTALTAGVYTIAGTGSNSCVDTTTTTLATMPLPLVTTTNQAVCFKKQALLACTGSTDVAGYLWTGPAAYTTSAPTATVVSASNVAPVNYVITVTAQNGCTAQAVATLSTYALPVVAATSGTICKNQPFTSVASGAVSYTWSGPVGNATGATYSIASVNGSAVGSYTITGTDANTCSNVATFNMDTLPLPVVLAKSSTVCIGKSATLMASGAAAYVWTGPAGYSSNLPSAIIAVTNNALAQTYTVVGTGANTCTQAAYATLATYPLPLPTFTAPARICFNNVMALKGAGAKTYTWTGPYNYFSANQSVNIPVFNMQQAGTYTLSVTDSLGCNNTVTTLIQIDPSPAGKLVSDNGNNYCTPFCSTFWLQSSSAAAIVGTSWWVNNQDVSSQTFSLCMSKAGNSKAVGTFTDAAGCTNTLSFVVQANPSPVADFDFLPNKPVENMDLVLFNDQSHGEQLVSWNWHFIDNRGFSSTNQNPSYTFEQAGTYAVAMQVSNSWGCVDTVVKTVIVSSDFNLFVPDAFTPNGDGLNDVFKPKGNGIVKYTLSIYDRWGGKIFETSDPAAGWDGTVKGSNVVDNVYLWQVDCSDAQGKTKTLTGHVTCVR